MVKAEEVNKQKQPALSEAFLLFLADMEEVDGEYVHPVDLSDDKPDHLSSVAEGDIKDKIKKRSVPKTNNEINDETKSDKKKLTAPEDNNDER